LTINIACSSVLCSCEKDKDVQINKPLYLNYVDGFFYMLVFSLEMIRDFIGGKFMEKERTTSQVVKIIEINNNTPVKTDNTNLKEWYSLSLIQRLKRKKKQECEKIRNSEVATNNEDLFLTCISLQAFERKKTRFEPSAGGEDLFHFFFFPIAFAGRPLNPFKD